MRSIRRGIKEMDILLQGYAEANLTGMDTAQLDLYEAMLNENDQDLLQWVTGQMSPPEELADLVKKVSQTYQK
ncbi:succinate dehydrogenase assembly factor 2 [Epibacterium ulvae]|uniref:succinate dehydrogenase assembly factor 2 n=1 Tax=Epibacterium ulvae TaxID=1156985 RepID=UPI001BFC5055|nr:succinate dehydrogenase assembly factor 2 [Epibacterium ulvae]MBT8152965.1 succinate dehydrogenase assembly factor 2 [Epibacterium ulvae]